MKKIISIDKKEKRKTEALDALHRLYSNFENEAEEKIREALPEALILEIINNDN